MNKLILNQPAIRLSETIDFTIKLKSTTTGTMLYLINLTNVQIIIEYIINQLATQPLNLCDECLFHIHLFSFFKSYILLWYRLFPIALRSSNMLTTIHSFSSKQWMTQRQCVYELFYWHNAQLISINCIKNSIDILMLTDLLIQLNAILIFCCKWQLGICHVHSCNCI